MKRKIFLATPTTQSTIDSQAFILREIQELYKDHIEFVYPKQCVRRLFHDFARNSLVEEFLESDAEVLWFLDSDVTPNKYVMELVACHWDKWEVSGAVYPVFMNPPGSESPEVVFTAYKKSPSGNLTSAPVPTTGQDFIDGLATGCLFIKRDVFSKLTKPYFEFKYEPETRNLAEGEDLGFCRKLSALGIKFFTDFGLACKHQKSVDLLDVNNYAISYSNRNILAYDQRIKETVVQAMATEFKRGFVKGTEGALKHLEKASKPKSGLYLPGSVLDRGPSQSIPKFPGR